MTTNNQSGAAATCTYPRCACDSKAACTAATSNTAASGDAHFARPSDADRWTNPADGATAASGKPATTDSSAPSGELCCTTCNGAREREISEFATVPCPDCATQAKGAAAAGEVPDLTNVIHWLEGGCDPKRAAIELRAYQRKIGQEEAPELTASVLGLTRATAPAPQAVEDTPGFDKATGAFYTKHKRLPNPVEIFELGRHAALTQQSAEPYGWIQFIDGVKTQNFARDESELEGIKKLFRVLGHTGKDEYVPVYLATPASQAVAEGAVQETISTFLQNNVDNLYADRADSLAKGIVRVINVELATQPAAAAPVGEKGGA